MGPKRSFTALIGNVLEHYDTALYGFLSPFIAPIFFPEQEYVMALILSYVIFALGMIVRPLGALVFGRIGDTQGRRQALFLSLTGIAITSALMGFLPTFHQMGYFAPILLFLGRSAQNFFAAGENVGGAIYLIEKDHKNHDLMSSFFGSSTIIGILLASGAVSLLCHLGSVETHWRMLYFMGSLTAVFGCFIRRDNTIQAKQHQSKVLFKDFWKQKSTILTIAFASGFSYATYAMAFVMINGFVPMISEVSKKEIMDINTGLLFLDCITMPIFGWLATRLSREILMISAAICALILGAPLFALLDHATLTAVIFVRICIVIIGVWFSATLFSWASSLVPQDSRYSVISVSYALGAQVLGGPTAALSLWAYHQSNIVESAACYWMGLGFVTAFLMVRAQTQTKYQYT